MPIITLFLRDTDGFRKQGVCVCVCARARICVTCVVHTDLKVEVELKLKIRMHQTHATPTAHACEPLMHTHAKNFFREPFVPRENTVISGISKLKGSLILEVQYLGSKSMKLKKSNGFLKSMISTFKFQIRLLIFRVSHVPRSFS